MWIKSLISIWCDQVTLRDLVSSLCFKASIRKTQEKYLDQEKSSSATKEPQSHWSCWGAVQLAFSIQFIQQAAWHGATGKGSSGSTHTTFITHKPGELLESTHYIGLLVSTLLLPIKSVPPTPHQQLQLVWLGHPPPSPPVPSDICSGAELAPVPSNLGNEPEDFNGVSMENKAKGILALSTEGWPARLSSSPYLRVFSLVHSLNLKRCLLSCCWKPAVYHLYC